MRAQPKRRAKQEDAFLARARTYADWTAGVSSAGAQVSKCLSGVGGGASFVGGSRHPRSVVCGLRAGGLGLVEQGLGLGLERVYLLLAD